MKVDVAIIGAGISGLACARSLTAAGFTTVVIEASSRIGGRIRTLRLPGMAPVEMGAQVVHGDRAATWKVIREAGLRTARVTSMGDIVFRVDGRTWTVNDVRRVRAELPWTVEDRLMRGRTRPADHSAEEVLQRHEGRGIGRTLGLEWLAQTWCANPAELSVAGIKKVREAWDSGEGEFKLLDGYDQIPHALARGLNVRLQCPVRLVSWNHGSVGIHAQGELFESRAAVITVPPAAIAAGGILFDPALPADKSRAAYAIGAGPAVVLIATLIKPAPRSQWALVIGQNGFWRVDAGATILRGWLKGLLAIPSGRLPCNGEQLMPWTCGVFPWLRAGDITAVHCVNWSADPLSRAGYSFPKVGSLDASTRWAAPLADALFFAGEATCGDRHLGLAHGALESGERAAAEVLAALTGNYRRHSSV